MTKGISGSTHRRIQSAADHVRTTCEQHGVDRDALRTILHDQLSEPGRTTTVDYLCGRSDNPPSLAEMRLVVAQIEKILDLSGPLDVDLASPGHRIARLARDGFAATVLLTSGWVVIGAIISGQNEFARTTSPGITVCILACALLLLALLEAAHIGAVALSGADVSTLEKSHPRVHALHRHIATKRLLEEYLAARQVGVVLVVFLISEVTRTTGLHNLPGTSIPIPSIGSFLLEIGVPGALLVLVIGQVTPQILTARRPAAMMNMAPMAAAFHLTRGIGMLGLARPASWLVQWATKTERIKSAARERFIANSLDVDGIGILSIRRTLTISHDGTISTTCSTARFSESGWTTIPMEIASAIASPRRLQLEAHLVGAPPTEIVKGEVVRNRLQSGAGERFTSAFSPRIGTFDEGDVLSVTSVLELNEHPSEDIVIVTAATKLVTFHVVLEHAPVPMAGALLSIVREIDNAPVSSQHAPARMLSDGSVEIVAIVYYPDPGTVLRLCWDNALAAQRTVPGQQLLVGATQ